MGFKYNKTGNWSIPTWGSGVGNYSVTGAFKYAAPGSQAFQIILSGSGTAHILYQDTGNTLKLKHGSTITISGLVVGDDYWYEESRTGNTVTLNVYNYTTSTKTIGSLLGTGTLSYGGTSIPYDSFGATSTGTLPFDGEMSGSWVFIDDASAVRTYEFDQPVGFSTLPDSTLAQDGVKSNSNNGNYTGSGTDSISITSHVDGEFIMRSSAKNSKVVTLSGAISGVTPTSVEVSVDYGAWVTIDASPTASSWSGSVTLTAKQSVRVRGVGASTETLPLVLIVGMTLAAIGDSNQYGYGINLQPVELPALSYQPLMYDGSTLVDVSDPTTAGADGSTLPRIVSRYATDGTPVCIYNIGNPGTKASDWKKLGSNYSKLAAFAALVGGIEAITVQLGTNDAAAGVTSASFAADMNSIVDDIALDFSAITLITKFASETVGSVTNRADIFTAIDSVVNSNSNAYAGGDLSGIDISVAANALNDGVHLKLDADLVTAADIIYDANLLAISSTLNLSITGITAGSYNTLLTADGVEVYNDSATYTAGALSLPVQVAVGSTIKGFVDDAGNPSAHGAYLEGVTA